SISTAIPGPVSARRIKRAGRAWSLRSSTNGEPDSGSSWAVTIACGPAAAGLVSALPRRRRPLLVCETRRETSRHPPRVLDRLIGHPSVRGFDELAPFLPADHLAQTPASGGGE